MMPIFAWPGVMSPGQFAPIRRACGKPRRKSLTRIMSWIGIPSLMHTIKVIPAAAASMIASAAKGAGTKMPDAVAPVAWTASATVLKTGTPRCFAPPLPGLIPPTTFVPSSCICSVWKPPSRPVMPWTRTFVEESRRMVKRPLPPQVGSLDASLDTYPRQFDDLFRRLPTAHAWLDAILAEDLAPLLLARPAHSDHERKLHVQVVARRDDAHRDLVATRDPAEHVDHDSLDLRVHEDHCQCVLDHLGLGAAADIAEVRGSSARALHQVESAHAQTGSVADDPDVAIERDISQVALLRLDLVRVAFEH